MSKRPRCLVGLGFVLGWHGTILEGFVVPPSFSILTKKRESVRNPVFPRKVVSSTCRLLAQMGDSESGDDVQHPTSWNSSQTIETSKEAMHPSLDSTPDGMRRRLSLTQLLAELDERDIRYHPSAARSDLERLLEKSQNDLLSLKELIIELDRQDIRYPPTASRQELAALLKSSQNNDTAAETGEPILKDQVPLAEILTELEQRNMQYPPTPSRTELETLLLENKPGQNQARMSHAKKYSRSLQSIINELDERNIRYRPTDTKVELEALLSRPPSARVASDSPAQRRHGKELANLDRRGIPYSPATTGAELKSLSQRNPMLDSSQVTPDRPARRRRMPLETLLTELDQRGIRYSPTATKAELEELLQNAPISNVQQPASSQVTSNRPARSRRIPIEKLLSELDRFNIRYSPMATRAELEGLLQKAPTSNVERRLQRRRQRQKSQDTPVTDLLVHSTRVAAKGVQRLPRKVHRVASSWDMTSRLSKVVERATRQARRVSRRASEFWREDENGVCEPDWHYVKVDTPIDVPAVRLDEKERGPTQTPRSDDPLRRPTTRVRKPSKSARPLDPTQKPRTPESSRPPPQVARHPPNTKDTWPSVERIPKHRRRKRPATDRNFQKRLSGSPFILPAASEDTVMFSNVESSFQPESNVKRNGDGAARGKEQKSKPPGGEPNMRKRRIYSPYSKEDEEQDAFDRFGNLIADTADRILWGPEGDEKVPTRQGREQDKSDRDERKRKPRYWKDRLAEQVDYALGIHEDGRYYNSWEKHLEREQREEPEIETDYWHPFPTAKRKKPSKRGVNHRVPLWEEEGNLVSLLFGRTPSGGKLGIERFLDQRGTSPLLTTFFQSALKALLMVATYIFRWASVRGAVPQPIVVMGVTSAFLCARPRKRLWAVSLSLIAMRTIGELIHGYVYGDEDWEESPEDRNATTDESSGDGGTAKKSD